MLKLTFDMNGDGSRLERTPSGLYKYITIYNMSRFVFTMFKGNTTLAGETIAICSAYTMVTIPIEGYIDVINFTWSGSVGTPERCIIYMTDTNLNLVGQFRPISPITIVDNMNIASISEGMTVRPAATPHVLNLNAPAANTEYSVALPANTRMFSLMLQENDAAYRIAFEAGRVATPTAPFINIPTGGSFSQDNLRTSATIFFASTTANRWLQIIAWT